MLKRHVILIANTVAYGVTNKNVPATVVNYIVEQFTSRLDNLGNYSYEATRVVDEPVGVAANKVRDAIKKAGKSCELLFIYYFGHGVCPPEADDDLYLFFKDSDWLDLPSRLDFRDSYAVSSEIPKHSVVGFIL